MGINIDPNVGDIRHRHLLVRYPRQIFQTEKCHSDIGSVPISHQSSFWYPTLKENNYSSQWIQTPLNRKRALCTTKLRCLSVKIGMSDIGYRIKLYNDIQYNVGLRSLSPISEVPISGSVDIADHGYRTNCPPMVLATLQLHLVHRWTSPFSHNLQTDKFHLFLHQQMDKQQTSVCTMSKQCQMKENRLAFRFPY